MDILHLVDRLEELFNESRPIPLTHSVVVDEDRVLELIDQMRISIPPELSEAQKVLTERDRTLAQAQEEANRTLNLAQERAEQSVSEHPIVQGAEERREQILSETQAEVAVMRQEADEHVVMVLSSLVEELSQLSNQARNGIADIEAKRLQAVAEKQPPLIEES